MENQLLFNFMQPLFRKMPFRIVAFTVLTLLTVQSSFAQQWNIIGNESQISSVVSNYTSIAVVGDVPYVAYVEATGSGNGKVKKLDAGSWVQVGSNLGTNVSFTRIFKDKNGKLYVTYIDNGSSSKLAVKTFDGMDWVKLGTLLSDEYVSTGSATHALAIADIRSDLAFDSNNVPYVTFSERTGTTALAYVKRFISGAWETVGGGAVSADSNTSGNGIVLDTSDVPYVVYINGSTYSATSGTVKTVRYNGTAWLDISSVSPVSGGSATTGNITLARNTAIAMDSANNPLVCYYNTNNSNKSTVIRYNGTSWSWLGVNGSRDGKGLSLINDTAGNVYNIFTDSMTPTTQPTTRVYKQVTPAGVFSEILNIPITTLSGVGIDDNSTNTAIAVGSDTSKPYIVYTKTNSSSISTPVVRFFDPTTKAIPTWNGSTWSIATVSTEFYDAILTGPYSTTTNGAFPFKVSALTINPGGSLTVNSGTNVTLQHKLVNNAGTNGVVVENNANLVQIGTTAVNMGNAVVNRNSNALSRLDYTMWSSPVAGQKLADFSPLTSQSPSRFYTYTAASNLYTAVATPTTTNFASGTGYLIRMPNTAVTAPATETFAGQFTGVPNNGTVTLSGLTATNYYAIGNPYPSTISASSFLTVNASVGTLYFWRKTNAASGSAYATYTSGGATTTTPTSATPNGTIQVGQGFIAKPGGTATTLVFTNAMRTANNSNQIFKTKAAEKDRVWLNLTNTAGVFSQALIGYMDGATSGVDEGIDGAYINDSPVALTSAINGEEYTIQGRALPFDASDVVALNFKTDVAGDYTIAIDHADGLFASGQDVYLVDSTTGTETNLKTDAYTFTATTGTANSRFSLKYQKTLKVDTPAFNENSVTVYKNGGTLYVNSGASAINNIKVFDIQGRLIAEQNNVNANATSLKNWKVNQQVLIVKVTSQDNTVVNKKVVN